MKAYIQGALLLLAMMLGTLFCPVYAGFYRPHLASDTSAGESRHNYTSPGIASMPHINYAGKGKTKGGEILAYLSIGLGVIGLALAGIHAPAFLILFGIGAGVFGKAGIRKNKHNSFLKTLCYIGIALGIILVVLGTVPILLT